MAAWLRNSLVHEIALAKHALFSQSRPEGLHFASAGHPDGPLRKNARNFSKFCLLGAFSVPQKRQSEIHCIPLFIVIYIYVQYRL